MGKYVQKAKKIEKMICFWVGLKLSSEFVDIEFIFRVLTKWCWKYH